MSDDRRFASEDLVPSIPWWRRLSDRVAGLAINAIPPLYRSWDRAGTRLDYVPRPTFTGIIRGRLGAAYIVAEARFDTATARYFEIDSPRVVTAYEYNLADTIADGTVVEVYYTIADDWRFWIPRGNPTAVLPPGPIYGCCPTRVPPPSTLELTCVYGTFTLNYTQFAFNFGHLTFPPGPFGQNRNHYWVKTISVFEPTAAAGGITCPNHCNGGAAGLVSTIIVPGNTVPVTYVVQCIPERVWYAPIGAYIEAGTFICTKHAFSVSIYPACCGTVGDLHMWPTSFNNYALGYVTGATYFGLPTSDPCAISLSAELVSIYSYDVVAMAETITVSE